MLQLHDSMHQLITSHEALLQLTQEKTELIKQGDTDQLAKLLMDERKQVQTIIQVEEKRQSIVDSWMLEMDHIEEERTMTALLETIEDDREKEQLEEQLSHLIQVIIELREIEQLNQQLLEQSMQYVKLSLEMLQPSIQNLNYDGKQQVQDAQKQSVFDSKA